MELLTALVRKYLARHGNRAAVPSSIRAEIEELGDADVELTLTHAMRGRSGVAEPATMSVGDSTSRGDRFVIAWSIRNEAEYV